ncbi:reverse transcriptase domain-containing protein [Muricoccus pecuniae]|uniref:Reverse transcriptase domain-containing protein n=1 Tax=Muricoccus pecuniae TaxID=693023 RepID=A0A840Y1N9_9PROT|nr:reverse transcriptase domain-containing protein [Roseomonas pecuniae]MBB5693520.1 hypothetical protein [Roseomonas pecuniae]
MIHLIQARIELEARKRIRRHNQDVARSGADGKRFAKRTGLVPKTSPPAEPFYWSLNRHFDPRYCLAHGKHIAKGLWYSLKSGRYAPRPAVEVSIKKSSGGRRNVRIFTIPDAALSSLLAQNLTARNGGVFSASSYAYRTDKRPLDAVIQLSNYIKAEKTYIIGFDFEKYFDNIPHGHLAGIVNERGLLLTTGRERDFIMSMLKHRFADRNAYSKGEFISCTAGVPQGSSISLFLANAAAHQLDLELERKNGVFCRYADDYVVVTYSYEDAISIVNTFARFSATTGMPLNQDKSSGVRLLTGVGQGEIRSFPHFSFLGYQFSSGGRLAMSDNRVNGIKRAISRMVYNNLLIYPRRGFFNSSRIGPGFRDWDLATCINEIRRYIYGGRTEKELSDYLDGDTNLWKVRGLMAYYCLVNDHAQLHALDGWLCSIVMRAYKQRAKLLAAAGLHVLPAGREQLLDGSWYVYPPISLETRLPSFFLAWRAARKKWERHGVGGVAASPASVYVYG